MDEERTQQGTELGRTDIKRQTVTAVVTRGGKLYNFGVIAYYHKNPIICAVVNWFVQKRLKHRLNKWGFKPQEE
jgi:hypothetical protein